MQPQNQRRPVVRPLRGAEVSVAGRGPSPRRSGGGESEETEGVQPAVQPVSQCARRLSPHG